MLAAPFALVLCPEAGLGFYRGLGWQVLDAPVTCDQTGRRVTLSKDVAVVLACQDRPWPAGPIDLCGLPW